MVVTLQGDDIFLDYIPESFRKQSIEQIKKLSESIDGFLVHSEYYASYMSKRLSIPPSKIFHVKLGIDHKDFGSTKNESANTTKRVGYLARLTPEKGFHHAVDAFIRLRRKRQDVEFAIAGWVGSEHKAFADRQFTKLNDAGLENAYRYHGAVDRNEKVEFLKSLSVFTVPTTYHEPKGRFALEAMACGVPVVLPDHGAFPEIVTESGCGVLVRPNDPNHLTETLHELLNDPSRCQMLGEAGRRSIVDVRSADAMARQTLELYSRLRNGE